MRPPPDPIVGYVRNPHQTLCAPCAGNRRPGDTAIHRSDAQGGLTSRTCDTCRRPLVEEA